MKKDGDGYMKIYVMSDIHGFSDAFITALGKVDLSGQNKLILLGDYMDYGLNSLEVIEIIINLQLKYDKEKIIALLGNHEKAFLDWIDEYTDINVHIANLDKYSNNEWLQSERDCDYETLRSFLTDTHMESFLATENMMSWDSRNVEAVRLLLEDAREIIDWLKTCPYYYETEKQIFVYAGIAEWADEDWLDVTSDDLMVSKYPASIGSFYKDIIAGHISTMKISNKPDFYGVFFDGKSHFYVDGTTYRSGKVPVLVYDQEKDKYYEI